jgi:2-methylisocitrate lyase-like PEP mutase family enzyme
MKNQHEKAEHFHALHAPGKPLVLFNIWDAGSAKAVAAAGAQAIATGSWSVANANGYADGEHTPLEVAIENLSRIVGAVDLPVTIDLESGYDKIAQTITQSIQAGAVGCNLEDSFPENGHLREIAAQVKRLEAARNAADQASLAYFINARTDVFLEPSNRTHDAAMIDETLERAQAYAAAGANGLFVPGLTDETLIAQLVAASPLPVNIMVGDNTPSLTRLAQLGVARVSHGPRPYLLAMKALEEAAHNASSD